MDQLKPCPFCGGKAITIIGIKDRAKIGTVGCTKCGCEKRLYRPLGYKGDIDEELAEIWNRRV